MTTEEKAKAYDKAIEKIKYVMEHGVSPVLNKEDLQDIFTELQESEGEKIRKAQLDYWRSVGGKEWHGVPVQEAIAWLEKQKPIEHFELKAGHWYICHRPFCCRADHLTVKEGERFMCEKDGVVKGFVIKDAEKYFKESNPPAPMEEDMTWLEKQKYSDFDMENEYWRGYDDAKKHMEEKQLTEQKPKWSEEDSLMIDSIIDTIKWLEGKGATDMKIDWLKSLKKRMEEQQ